PASGTERVGPPAMRVRRARALTCARPAGRGDRFELRGPPSPLTRTARKPPREVLGTAGMNSTRSRQAVGRFSLEGPRPLFWPQRGARFARDVLAAGTGCGERSARKAALAGVDENAP